MLWTWLLFGQTFEYFLKVKKLVRIDRFKVHLNSTMDLIVFDPFRLSIKNMYKLCFPLCKQLCTFMAYGYVQTKNNQNENYINEESNPYKFEKVKCLFH